MWTSTASFLYPITIESVTAHFDSSMRCPFVLKLYDVTFTGAHGRAVGDYMTSSANNNGGADPVSQNFRVAQVHSTTKLTLIWASHAHTVVAFPKLTNTGGGTPLRFVVGAGTYTVSALDDTSSARSMRLGIDCPYMGYSTDRRLNAKIFARDEFDERMIIEQSLNNGTTPAATDDMFPAWKQISTEEYAASYARGFECMYFDEESTSGKL